MSSTDGRTRADSCKLYCYIPIEIVWRLAISGCYRVISTLWVTGSCIHSKRHFLFPFVAEVLTLADLPMLQTRLDSVSGLWYPLGMELKVDTNILGGIPQVAGNDPSHCLSIMLMRWLQTKDPAEAPTLDTLARSLSSPSIAGGEEVAKSLV